jgi:hypothetical protein
LKQPLRGAPGLKHETRRRLLDAVATLIGYRTAIPVPLPDGSVPDVLRASVADWAVFVGEAKDTERPGGAETQARLAKYATWIRGRPSTGRLPNVIAVCYGRGSDTNPWLKVLGRFAEEAHDKSRVSHFVLPIDIHIAFVTTW